MSFIKFVAVVSLIFLCSAGHATEKTRLTMTFIDLPVFREFFLELYKTVNQASDSFEFEMQFLPLTRVQKSANDGTADGIGIIAEPTQMDNQLDNLIKISTPFLSSMSILVINKDSPDIARLEDLRGKRVAIINGAVHAMNYLPKNTWWLVNSHDSGIAMLLKNRVAALSTIEISYFQLAKSRDFSEKTKLASLKKKIPFFMYIHKRHKDIVPNLELLMKELARRGDGQRIYDRFLVKLKTSKE